MFVPLKETDKYKCLKIYNPDSEPIAGLWIRVEDGEGYVRYGEDEPDQHLEPLGYFFLSPLLDPDAELVQVETYEGDVSGVLPAFLTTKGELARVGITTEIYYES